VRKLPIGIQTYSRLREENYLYIDKTKEALELIDSGSVFYFLSRPRRFGKSLFLSTLKEIFEANKKIFEGLYIYDRYNWSISYPVIKIDFFGNLRTPKDLQRSIMGVLKENQDNLGVACIDTDSYDMCLRELIKSTYQKYNSQVVVLIDEYDKAILDNLDQIEVAKANREIIKALYSVLKGSEEYIKFAFLTGVSKFSKASIFSGLNMLRDISLDRRYGNICGYTQDDIETTILPYLNGVDLDKLKLWYNGYNFLGDDVYNPFDILLFIDNDFIFDNYWFSTATPTYLIKLIEKNNYFIPKLSNITVDRKLLDSFDIDNIDLEVILYQSGYLTINEMVTKRRGGVEYKLKLPNMEVKSSFSDILIDFLTDQKREKLAIQDTLYDTLYDGEIEYLRSSLDSIFASIPYNNYTNNPISNYEGFYASIIYVYFQSLGIDIVGEDVTNRGRIDLTLKLDNYIYIVEFKIGKNSAIDQIKQKDYAQKYISDSRQIYIVGINFDNELKNISNLEWEKIER